MGKKYKKNIKKVLIIVAIFYNIFIPISNAEDNFWNNVITSGDEFVSNGTASSTEIKQEKLDDAVDTIYNALLTLGIVLSVLVGAILGIKFMAGSIEEQAKIKELLIPYVTGCVVIFGAFGIWKILMNVLSNV